MEMYSFWSHLVRVCATGVPAEPGHRINISVFGTLWCTGQGSLDCDLAAVRGSKKWSVWCAHRATANTLWRWGDKNQPAARIMHWQLLILRTSRVSETWGLSHIMNLQQIPPAVILFPRKYQTKWERIYNICRLSFPNNNTRAHLSWNGRARI